MGLFFGVLDPLNWKKAYTFPVLIIVDSLIFEKRNA